MSDVRVRITSSQPVIVSIDGVRIRREQIEHIKRTEVVGTREFRFITYPGELVIRFQGKKRFFTKPSDVTIEVEMYTSRDDARTSKDFTDEGFADLFKMFEDLDRVFDRMAMHTLSDATRDAKRISEEITNLLEILKEFGKDTTTLTKSM